MSESSHLGKILIVDDDQNIADFLRYNLTSEGFSVMTVSHAKDVDFSEAALCRLAIIDAMDQQYTGIDLSCDLKSNASTANLPIIIYTERDGEDTIINAFDNGAEDVVMKPFSLRELIARIKAILRRHPMAVAPQPKADVDIQIPELNLSIDRANQKVSVSDTVIPLTKTEYAILIFLINNRNSFFTRIDICNEVWKEEASSNIRIVDTNISRLRKKLGESGKYIINRYGMGYAFVDKIANA